MDLRIEPGLLKGTVKPPMSKSLASRAILASYLYRGEDYDIDPFCDDVQVMKDAVEVLRNGGSVINCRDCAAALRFLLPVCGALGRTMRFTGSLSLARRPISELIDVLRDHGCTIDSNQLPMTISGKLQPGIFRIPGNISSQYISGLLFAFPLMSSESEIFVSGKLESEGYIDLTQSIIEAKGNVEMEADWSSASYFYAANYLGSDIKLEGMNLKSFQPDAKIQKFIKMMGKQIDMSQTPDLVPALAVAALGKVDGVTTLTGCGRLRLKESNRIQSVAAMINGLGGRAEFSSDSIKIYGSKAISGGIVDTRNDHRVAMAAAIAAQRCIHPVTIKNADCVSKSYPGFFEDLKALGGKILG